MPPNRYLRYLLCKHATLVQRAQHLFSAQYGIAVQSQENIGFYVRTKCWLTLTSRSGMLRCGGSALDPRFNQEPQPPVSGYNINIDVLPRYQLHGNK